MNFLELLSKLFAGLFGPSNLSTDVSPKVPTVDTMPGWKIGEKEYSFLDDYDNWEATHRPADK